MRTEGVYLLNQRDRDEIESLRFDTLVDAGHFIAQPEAVKWSDSDEKSSVLGVYSSSGVLLSTMRAEYIATPEELVPKLDYDDLHEVITLPCGLLGKASTRKEFQAHGLNAYLQYLAYQDFHARGLKYVVGTVMPTAHTVNLLRTLGYQFIDNEEGWRRHGYNSFGRTLVCYLDLEKNYQQVMSILEPKVRELKIRYPYSL